MSLDPRFIIAPAPQILAIDKDTQSPLSGGYYLFFQDNFRTVPMTVYEITGSPPNYSYTALGSVGIQGGWQVNLGPAGSPVDGNGQDTQIYYFPLDGTPDSTTNTQTLYYMEAYNAAGVFQWAREGWPNPVEGGGPGPVPPAISAVSNYIPNGQFLAHNFIPGPQGVSSTFSPGLITSPITSIAPGGWLYIRDSGSTAVDTITFLRTNGAVTNPSGNPRYAVLLQNTQTSPSDLLKDIRVHFGDVNKFASTVQPYTFSVSLSSNGSGSESCELYLIKNFGLGASATTATPLTTFTFGNSYQVFTYTFIFGDNLGSTIGPNDDDYVDIVLRFPRNVTFQALITDVSLVQGSSAPAVFPVTTTAEFLYQSLMEPALPDYTGYDIGCPLILTTRGIDYDRSGIGDIIAQPYGVNSRAYALPCNGLDYQYNGYNPITEIPYSRLGNYMINNGNNGIPAAGTGPSNATAWVTTNSQNILIALNSNTAAASYATFMPYDGASPHATGWGMNTYPNTGITIPCKGAPTTGINTTGYFTTAPGVMVVANVAGNITYGRNSMFITTVILRQTPLGYSAFTMSPYTTSAGLVIGTVFQITAGTNQYYMWIQQKDGQTGFDPTPGGTGIPIEVISGWSLNDLAFIYKNAMSGNAVFMISPALNTGGGLSGGDYFTYVTSGKNICVWFTVNGAGSPPVLANTYFIPVAVLSTDIGSVIVSKTANAINQFFFAVPNLNGLILRANDPTQQWDFGLRSGVVPGQYGFFPGTVELDSFGSHIHTPTVGTAFLVTPGAAQAGAAGSIDTQQGGMNYSGGGETVPANFAVSYYIKY